MEQVQKKGMSKGCLVALIVAGVLLLLIIIAAITCYVKRDDLAKFGATTVISAFKTELRQHPVEGIDTTMFFSLTDSFTQRLQFEPLDYTRYSQFMNTVQAVMADKKLDSAEIGDLEDAMLDYFPELDTLGGGTVAPAEEPVPDTTAENQQDTSK
ncbi:MAG: hypothetical protein AB1644_00980 [Candidatus Zixiibacteriota bacterium]